MNSLRWLSLVITLIVLICYCKGEISLWMDKFQRDLCRERWSRMDWQSILRPCRKNMKFGTNLMDESLRSSTKWSHVLRTEIKKTGEFSRIVIQSRTGKGVIKKTGGDTWRVFIRGPSYIAPLVSDLNNGAYQATFLIMEPGLYRAEIILESSLCEGFQDPPKDWTPTPEWMKNVSQPERRWQKLRGGAVSFKVEPSDEEYLRTVRNSIGRWRNACGQQYQCELLWTGFGRWTNGTWMPLVEESRWQEDVPQQNSKPLKNKGKGTMLMLGDCMTTDLYLTAKDTTLCNGTFKTCKMHSNCRRKNVTKILAMDTDSSPNPSQHHLFTSLRNAIKSNNGSHANAMIVNFGHDRVEKMTFDSYKKLIDKSARYLPLFQGSAIWRTTASIWGPRLDPQTYFRSYQRTMLFNAYATSQMCAAGLPTLDVFQMATSYPQQPTEDVTFEDNFYDTVVDLIETHFDAKVKSNCGEGNTCNSTKRSENSNNNINRTQIENNALQPQNIADGGKLTVGNQSIVKESQSGIAPPSQSLAALQYSGQENSSMIPISNNVASNESMQIVQGASPVSWNGAPMGYQLGEGSPQITQAYIGGDPNSLPMGNEVTTADDMNPIKMSGVSIQQEAQNQQLSGTEANNLVDGSQPINTPTR